MCPLTKRHSSILHVCIALPAFSRSIPHQRLAVIFFFSKYRPSISSALLHNQLFIPPFSEVREIMKGFVARNKVQRRFPGARVSEGEGQEQEGFSSRVPLQGRKGRGRRKGCRAEEGNVATGELPSSGYEGRELCSGQGACLAKARKKRASVPSQNESQLPQTVRSTSSVELVGGLAVVGERDKKEQCSLGLPFCGSSVRGRGHRTGNGGSLFPAVPAKEDT